MGFLYDIALSDGCFGCVAGPDLLRLIGRLFEYKLYSSLSVGILTSIPEAFLPTYDEMKNTLFTVLHARFKYK